MKDIPFFEQLYAITPDGEIWSYYKQRFLTPHVNKQGYKQIILTKNNIKYTKLIHRLVAETFLDNPNNWPIVNHKDENKLNNNINNLEWCNRKYNSNYGAAPLKQSQRMKNFLQKHPDFNKGKNNFKSIAVKCIETQEIFDTYTQAIQWCGLKSTVCLTDYFKGKQQSAGKHPITHQPLHWEKYENGQWIPAIQYNNKPRNNLALRKPVICIETNEIFESVQAAQNYYGIKHISECCKGQRKTSGNKHWEYYKPQGKEFDE